MKIQMKRGIKADLPILSEGEMGFCIDTKEVFVGNGVSNTLVTNENLTYTHTQLSPASTWNIKHNLNKFPATTVVDSAGSLMVGDITYISENELNVSFIGTFSGKAYLN